MSIEEINEESFEEKVIKSDSAVVIDFWAGWCGPCRMFSPIFEELAKDYKNVKFIKVNVDENETIARKYKIMSIPTTLLFKGGEVKASMIGAVPKESVKKWIEDNLKE